MDEDRLISRDIDKKIGTSGGAPDRDVLDTSSPESLSLWHDLLWLQVSLLMPHEFDHLLDWPSWPHIKSVLDVGCGNGDYIAQLHSLCPEKTYTGIDVSAELIAVAKKQHVATGLQFHNCDFFAYPSGSGADLILMRFLVQHLTDFPAILAQAAALTSADGNILIIEPDRAACLTIPDLPLFSAMLSLYEHANNKRGRMRNRLSDIPAMTVDSPAWRLVQDSRIAIPSIEPLAGGKVFRICAAWLDLCERCNLFSFPFDRVRAELESWSSEPATFARFGLRIFHLERRRGPGGLTLAYDSGGP